MTIGQSSASGRSPVRWSARPWFFLTWTFATPIHNTYDFTILKTKKKPDLTLFTIETQPSFFFPSNTFLCRTHLSVFGVPPSRSARPQIHGNRGQWRNSHKPHCSRKSIFARLSWGSEAVRAADRADVRDTCASSSHFLLAEKCAKITEYRDTAPLNDAWKSDE